MSFLYQKIRIKRKDHALNFGCFDRCCKNLRSCEREPVKLLDDKMNSLFMKYPAFKTKKKKKNRNDETKEFFFLIFFFFFTSWHSLYSSIITFLLSLADIFTCFSSLVKTGNTSADI